MNLANSENYALDNKIRGTRAEEKNIHRNYLQGMLNSIVIHVMVGIAICYSKMK